MRPHRFVCGDVATDGRVVVVDLDRIDAVIYPRTDDSGQIAEIWVGERYGITVTPEQANAVVRAWLSTDPTTMDDAELDAELELAERRYTRVIAEVDRRRR